MEKSEIIADAIVSIMNTVPGIGRVYKQIPYVRDEREVLDYLTVLDPASQRVINAIGFTSFSRLAVIKDNEAFEQEERQRLFIFILYYSYNFENNTDTTVRELADKITNIFNANQTLNNTVDSHSKLDLVNNNVGKFTNTLCHILGFEMTTTDYEILED